MNLRREIQTTHSEAAKETVICTRSMAPSSSDAREYPPRASDDVEDFLSDEEDERRTPRSDQSSPYDRSSPAYDLSLIHI